MKESMYAIGQKYELRDRNIEIVNRFVDTARDFHGKYYKDNFYVIKVYPEKVFCVIQEDKITKQIIIPYIPTIGGVGSKGCISTRNNNVQYKVWQDMIYRCYYKSNTLYQGFGALGVSVTTKWLCFEYFLYDWDKIPGAPEAMREYHIAHTLNFNREVLDLPMNQRVYKLENCYISRFGGSQVAYVYNNIKAEQLAKKNNTPHSTPVLIQDAPNNKNIYTTEDYERVIKNPQLALAGYVDHADIVEKEINPLYGPISPVVEPREPGKKVMCIIVPDDIRKQNREK